MIQEIVKARKEFLAGRETERNLPCYLTGMAGVYYRLANYNLAMQYTAFAEAVAEGDLELSEPLAPYGAFIKETVTALAENEGAAVTEETVSKLLSLREELTTSMQALTAYTDRLYLHEYALTRMAPEMEGTVEEIDSNRALEEISSFLFSDEEQDGLLARVSLAVSELPVRMTKAKFMEWVRSTASVYTEADRDTLDRVFYMLYSAAGLYAPEGMEQFANCKEALSYFEGLEYKELTEEAFFEAKDRLAEITEFIATVSDGYFMLAEMINNLLVLALTGSYVGTEDRKATEGCRQIFGLLAAGADYTDAALVEAFEAFEGKPEEIEEFLFAEEGYLDELPVKDSLLEAMMQKVLFTRVMYARTLHTTSVFVELEKKEQDDLTFPAALDAFCEAVVQALESGARAINRGRMARIIQNLPLPFTKKSDIQKYILASLENCHDMSEKTAAMRAIRELAEGM